MMGSVQSPDRMALQPLVEPSLPSGPSRGGDLPDAIRTRYGGDLAIRLRPDRPTVIANFVSTLDGVVSYNTPEQAGGGEISGFFEPDRFVMGLLRAVSDVVLVGAGTVRAAPDEAWTPGFIGPDWGNEFAALRRRLGLAPQPITAVVTGSGDIDLTHPGLADPAVDVVLITSDAGAATLAGQPVPRNVTIRSTGGHVDAHEIVRTLAITGAELIVCEGGPRLFGQVLAARLVDELFLTLAPQLAGRSEATPRLGLVEGTAFDVARAPWARLADLRRAGNHVFARYRLDEGKDE